MTVESSCPDSQVLERLLLGLLPEDEASALETHADSCPACLERMRSPRTPDRFLDDLRCSARPVDRVPDADTALLAKVCRLPALVGDEDGRTPEPGAADPPEAGPVGGYRLLRLLGRGGMGVVYLARHERLKRTVALKLIGVSSQANPERLARFRRETELLARLRHANVVPIYEAGEHEGRPYLAMEYVEGGTLAEKLTAGPLPVRTVAEVVEALARGAHAAHECGVVHRDLKPANVLLAEDGTPRITDFGLAKPLAPQPEDSSAAWDTGSGAILGTPSYMAPEQVANSREVGPAADVYALGAILYECLIGRPPFKAATPLETLEQVRNSEPVSPRSLQPGVPRDLETVCLKCLPREPRRRYPSALALAEDLRRFLDGRSVLARPTPVWERLAKWARRRPAVATLVLVSVLALAGLAAGVVVHDARLRDEVERTDQQRRRADANYRQAREAMTKMLASASARNKADLPRLRELLREQREAALAFFLRIAEQPESDSPEVKFDVAHARLEAAKLQSELGRWPESRDNMERAVALFADLAGAFPAEPRYRSDHAHGLNALGTWHGHNDEAARYHGEALAIQEALEREGFDAVENRIGLAVSYHNLGTIAYERKQWEEADRLLGRAVDLRREVLRERPEDSEILAGLAQTCVNLSSTHQRQKGHRDQAQKYHDLAATTLDGLIERDPFDFTSITALAVLRINWAYVLLAEGQDEQALTDLGKNVVLLEAALRQEPSHATLRGRLVASHAFRAQILEGRKRYREALADRKRAVELMEPGPDRNFQRLFLAETYARAGDHANAVVEAEALMADPPSPASYYNQFSHLAGVCGHALAALREDAGLTSSDRDARAERYAATAVVLLAKTRDSAGPDEWKKLRPGLRADATFEPLHGRPDFERLFKD
jgi:serine/threonine-protein kinase